MVAEIIRGTENPNKEMLLEFVAHEVELLSKKKSTGQTKTQKENEELKIQLLEALGELGKPVTVSEFMAQSTSAVATLSNQILSALLRQLVVAGKVVKTTEKKKSYFAVV